MKGLSSVIDRVSTPWTRIRRSRRIKALIHHFDASWTRYTESGKIEDLENTISRGRIALTLCTPGHRHRANLVSDLFLCLIFQYEQTGKMDDLEEGIACGREALALQPPGHPDRPISLNNLALGLKARYRQLGKTDDLQEAIEFDREALTLRPARHPDRPSSLNNLANGLLTRYEQSGKMHDLDQAILFYREALALCPLGHPDRPSSLNNLANGLLTRYRQSGKTCDLEEAIVFHHKSLTLRPPGHPDRPSSLSNLAAGLRTRYEGSGKMDDLDEAIVLDHEALSLRSPGHPDRPTSLNNLAAGLRARYRQLGKMDDLEEAIMFDREGLKLRPLGHPDRPSSLNNLAVGLKARYRQLGKMDDLEEAIMFDREGLKLRPLGHPDRPSSLNNLSLGLETRYQQLGKMDDLEEAIVFQREALALCPPGHPNRSTCLNNLALGLGTRYEQLGKMADLDEALVFDLEALTLCPPGQPDRRHSLNNLAIRLLRRYEQLGKMDDLDGAIAFDREALALCPLGHPYRSSSLSNLASNLRTRYQHFGKMDDLDEAIILHHEALTLCPPGHPSRSYYLNKLAHGLSTQDNHLGKMVDLQAAFLYYKQSASDSTSYLHDRLTGVIVWAKMAMEYQHHSTLDAFTMSLTLLSRSLVSRPDIEAQHGFLSAADIPKSLASDAASAAIRAGNLELAVEFLEQGRALLWSKIDAYKYPLEQLRQVQGGGELADRLETLSNELERLVLLSDRTRELGRDYSPQVSLDARIKRHRILSEEWEALVGKIREMPGFTHFLQTPPFDTLRLAAAEGPVILINISDYRSDAIILTIDNPPILVPLSPLITVWAIGTQLAKLSTNQGIISVLRYLWEYIVSPVVTQLTQLGVEHQSRIWWCPTAELCALPLHAAGPYRLHEPNLPDIYTSSYISTLSSLIKARSGIQFSESPKLLVIGQPHESLEKVGAEVRRVIKQADNVLVDSLLGAEATHEAVLSSLKQHSWAHFACHGHLADNDQLFPSFELFDGRRLTLLELIQARLPNAECAFLAACHSAGGDSRTRDEHIHLSAALQFCGFRSVVGTLWEMFDEDGPMISKEFYKYMFRDSTKIDFRDSAYALNFAVREMRKAKLPPEHWVMFVHIGA